MYAIINIGGKQYKVSKNETLKTEKINSALGKKIKVDMLFLQDDKSTMIGEPLVKDKKAVLEVVSHGKDEKVNVFKYKPKKRYRKKIGHRQSYSVLKFVDVESKAKKTTAKKESATTKKASNAKKTTTTTKKSTPKKTAATTKKATPKKTASTTKKTTKKTATKSTTSTTKKS